MLNKFAYLLGKDKQVQMTFVLLLAVFCLTVFLKNVNNVQERLLAQLQTQKNLVLRIPELQKQQVFAPLSDISLSGIIFNIEASVAIINNSIVKAGDQVGPNTKVVSIKSDAVVLNDGVKDFELKLPE